MAEFHNTNEIKDAPQQAKTARYDVFLCHNTSDKAAVEAIALSLMRFGINCWLDKWNLIPGTPWQADIEAALEECGACAVFIGKSGFGPWQNEEMRAAIQRRVSAGTAFRVIPVALPGARQPDITLPAFLSATTWVTFDGSLSEEEVLYRLVCGIRGVPPGSGNPVSAEKRVNRVDVSIRLRGNADDFRSVVNAAQSFLRNISGDASLSINFVKEGSVDVLIQVSDGGFEKLKFLIENNIITTLAGFPITSISAIATHAVVCADEGVEGTSGKQQRAATSSTTVRLFIGNLPYVAVEADLENFFAAGGFAPRNITIMRDRFSGEARGFAFAEFGEHEAEAVVETCDGRDLMGRSLVISIARPTAERAGERRKDRDNPTDRLDQ